MLRCRLSVLAVGLVAVHVVLSACKDATTLSAGSPDSGSVSGAVGDGICPTATSAPRAGDVCALPDGTECLFDECGAAVAQCQGGSWRYSGNPPKDPVCPDDPPPSDKGCPPCWPATAACHYGSDDCAADGASAKRAVATCPLGVWKLTYSPCGAGGEPLSDAGADVQGDAAAAAD